MTKGGGFRGFALYDEKEKIFAYLCVGGHLFFKKLKEDWYNGTKVKNLGNRSIFGTI